jgi:iron complex outermembrane receptor protein
MNRVACALALFAMASAAVAQQDGPKKELPAGQQETPPPPLPDRPKVNRELEEVRQQAEKTPANVTVIESPAIRESRQIHLQDVLRHVPGVFAQPRFGSTDETQLNLRGSSAYSNAHIRGVNIYWDGVPLRRADGFTDLDVLELVAVESIQVYKGGQSLRLGTNMTGGAVYLQTKSGQTQPSPLTLWAQGGSFGLFKGAAESGSTGGPLEYYVTIADTEFEGFRDHSRQSRQRAYGKIAYALGPQTELQLQYLFSQSTGELPGSLTRPQVRTDRDQASPIAVAGDFERDQQFHLVGVLLRHQLNPASRVELNPFFTYRDLEHPVAMFIEDRSTDSGLEARYINTVPLFGRSNQLVVGVQSSYGMVDHEAFANVAGSKGALAARDDQQAMNAGVFVENTHDLSPHLAVVGGVRYDYSDRAIVDDAFLADGNQERVRIYHGLTARAGTIYTLFDDPSDMMKVFANIARTYQPPTLVDLAAIGMARLNAEEAWHFEIGTRGRWAKRVEYQVSVFDQEIAEEILIGRNADRTRHIGTELDLAVRILEGWAAESEKLDALRGRVTYTFIDARFVDDPMFDGNDIPGLPRHRVTLELRYDHPVGIYFAPGLEWVPQAYFVDSLNTVENHPFVAVYLQMGYVIADPKVRLFLEARNLNDADYGATFVDAGGARFFQPAEGPSVYGGASWTY